MVCMRVSTRRYWPHQTKSLSGWSTLSDDGATWTAWSVYSEPCTTGQALCTAIAKPEFGPTYAYREVSIVVLAPCHRNDLRMTVARRQVHVLASKDDPVSRFTAASIFPSPQLVLTRPNRIDQLKAST